MHHGSIYVVVSSFSQRSFQRNDFRQDCSMQAPALKSSISSQQQDVREVVYNGDISIVVPELTLSPSSMRVVVCRELSVMVQVG